MLKITGKYGSESCSVTFSRENCCLTDRIFNGGEDCDHQFCAICRREVGKCAPCCYIPAGSVIPLPENFWGRYGKFGIVYTIGNENIRATISKE